MAHKYAAIAFTNTVRQVQQQQGSRNAYAAMDQGEDYNYLLSENEAQFIQARDSFYMASVSETGWPYVQHRGGAKGFLQVLDAQTIAFADFKGNRQYVSTGNFQGNDRVSLILMDYPNRTRLKILGRVSIVTDDWELLARLEQAHYRAVVERAFVITIEAFDWNCPQHITPRYSEAEMATVVDPLLAELEQLKRQSESPVAYPKVLGQGPLPLVISGIRQLAPRVRAYELRHKEGQALPEVRAGSHLKIPVQLPNGESVIRHYSICSNPKRRDIYEIAVQKEEQGQGGSLAIYQTFQLGLQLNCDQPANFFAMHQEQKPAVLIAGGIGITPIKAMAQFFADQSCLHSLHYAGKTTDEMAFYDRLSREFGAKLQSYTADTQRLSIKQILSTAPDNAVFYACGPQQLLDELISTAKALNIADQRIQIEAFSADSSESGKPFTARLLKSATEVQVSKDQSLLDAMLDAGIEHPHSCKTGTCRSCAVKVIEGEVDHKDQCLSPSERKTQLCPCVSRSHSDLLLLDL